jgi:hypothetical protein
MFMRLRLLACRYVVQFKKGVFELGVPINPIAIKYNKVRHTSGWERPDFNTGCMWQVFVDAYWNSREQSFAQHLITIMTVRGLGSNELRVACSSFAAVLGIGG